MPALTRSTFLAAVVTAAFAAAGASVGADEPTTRSAETAERIERWEPDIAKFEAADDEQMPEAGGVVFVGSSTIRGWDLPRFLPEVASINRGFGGSQMRDIPPFAHRIISKYQPSTVVVYSGDNDLNAGESPDDILSELDRVVREVRGDLPDVKFVILSIKPSPAREALLGQMIEMNDRFEQYAEGHQGVSYVDIETPVLDADGRPRGDLFIGDGLHLNDAGYALITEAIRPHLPASGSN